jgi:hypothetical protein
MRGLPVSDFDPFWKRVIGASIVSISVLFSYDRFSARMVELVDTRDLKSRGPGRVRAGSSPAPGTKSIT